jgi:glyoxylase-like metal-dependent hydrolase (beta-lactamase superfamily II)
MRTYNRIQAIAALATCTLFPAQAFGLEAAGVVKRASATLGVDAASTLRYSAAGAGWGFGQPYTAGAALPRQNVSFVRSVNYETGSVQDEYVRSRAEQRGGTGVPLTGEQRVTEVISGDYAWNVVGTNTVPGARYVAERRPLPWLTPHGALRAAEKSKATLEWQNRGAKSVAVVSWSEPGKYRAKAYIDDNGLVERVDAVIPNPVMGDLPVSIAYSEYRDYGKIKFPGRIEERQGGATTASLIVTDVQPGAKVEITVPDAVRNAREVVSAEKAADGVWYLTGGSHNSVVIEMKDHIVVVEGPLTDGRGQAVIDEAKKLVPNKPIRYVVNSHVHFDHSGGLGAFIADGATVVTHASNRAFYQKAFSAPRSINPDLLASGKKRPEFKTVTDKAVLTDGARTVELHHIRDTIHNDGMLMAYLPKERILIEADVYTPGPANAPAAAKPAPTTVNLVENVDRLKLAVDRVLPLHGRMVPAAEMYKAAGR